MSFDDIPKKTNAKNVVTNFVLAGFDLDLLAFKNNIFTSDDIRVRGYKWSLPYDMC